MNTAASSRVLKPSIIRALLIVGVVLVASSSEMSPTVVAQSPATLTINGSKTYQVIDGFGASANAASWKNGELRPGLDLLVDRLGATIWRVVIENGDWEATNDNADPAVFNWTYYNTVYTSPRLEALWSTIAYLNQKGISDGVMLNVMGPVAPWMGGSRVDTAAEDEWVEMIASLAYYGRVTRGLKFAMLAPMNETDWDGIEGPQVDSAQYVRLLRKLSLRLDGIGLGSLRLVGPDTAQVYRGIDYMAAMIADNTVLAKVDHFAFHDYGGSSGDAGQALQNYNLPTRNFWITETTNIDDILSHLTQGPSAVLVWDAYDSVYNHAILAGRGTTAPNDAGDGPALLAYNAATGIYTPRRGFYEAAQLFKFVPAGSRRIDVTSSNSSVGAIAFLEQSGGRLSIVGRNISASARTLTGSLAGVPTVARLELYETNASASLVRRSDVIVTNGGFSVEVAGSGVFTLTSATAPDTTPPVVFMTEPGNGSRPTGSVAVSATATDNVAVSGVQFLLDGVALNAEDTAAPYTTTWNTSPVASGSHQLSARVRDAAGNGAVADPVSVSVDNSDTILPAVALTTPATATTVTGVVSISATASDNIGVSGVQFLLDGAAFDSEDASAPYSVSWNTATAANGSHTLSGRARDSSGNQATSALVTVTVANTTTIPAGLVASYGFEEGTGSSTIDNSGRGHVGTISGAAWTTAGRSGKGLSFDGVNDLVTVADAADLDLTLGATLEAWILPTMVDGWRTVALKEAVGELAYALYASDEGSRPAMLARIDGTTSAAASPDPALPNVWRHLAGTYDGATLRLYVNGIQVGARALIGVINATASPLMIGGNSVWNEFFAGTIDDLRVYNRALSPNEILADMTRAVTTALPVDTIAPKVTTTLPLGGTLGVSTTTPIAATFSEPMDIATITAATVTLRSVAAMVNTTIGYSNGVVTLTPLSPLAAGTAYTATVKSGASGVKDRSGNALPTDRSWSFTTAAAPAGTSSARLCPCGFWTASTPAGPVDNDRGAIELGARFRSDTRGYIKGVRFYKHSRNTGTHTGSLWGATGALLGTVTFGNETASGWQTATFASPIAITANTTYVVSYHTNAGFYAATNRGFTAGIDNAPLHALSSAAGGGNGVYRYGAASAFPNQSYDSTNYWVDVTFTTVP
jgi:hypothetical protein